MPPSSSSGDNSLLRKLDKKVGKKDVQKLKSFYETQLKSFQQNALKVEANLVNQIYQVLKCIISGSEIIGTAFKDAFIFRISENERKLSAM